MDPRDDMDPGQATPNPIIHYFLFSCSLDHHGGHDRICEYGGTPNMKGNPPESRMYKMWPTLQSRGSGCETSCKSGGLNLGVATLQKLCVCIGSEGRVDFRSKNNFSGKKGEGLFLEIENNIHISYNIFNHISMIFNCFYYYLNVFIFYFYSTKVWYHSFAVWYHSQKFGTKLLHGRRL